MKKKKIKAPLFSRSERPVLYLHTAAIIEFVVPCVIERIRIGRI